MYYSSKKTNKPVYFKEDIVEILSKKTGKSEELISDIIHHNLNYLREEISKNEDVVVVSFPNLGKLMFNYYLGKCSLAFVSNKTLKSTIRKRVDFIRDILTNFGSNSLKIFNKPILSTLTYQLEGQVQKNPIKTFYKDWIVLENKHNQDHEKYF
jgi:hypothetical protein